MGSRSVSLYKDKLVGIAVGLSFNALFVGAIVFCAKTNVPGPQELLFASEIDSYMFAFLLLAFILVIQGLGLFFVFSNVRSIMRLHRR